MKRCSLSMLIALAASCAGSALADVTYWQAGTDNWSEPTAWSDGEPDLFLDAEINNGGTVVIDQNGEFTGQLFLGTSAGETGNVLQSGGSATIDSVYVAFGEGTHGEYRLADGSLNAEDVIVAEAGTGDFIHVDGNNTAMTLVVGAGSTGQGTYQLGGGRIVADNEHIGRAGTGVFTQTDGTNMVSANLTLGGNDTYPGGSGTYNLLGGELRFTGNAGRTLSLAARDGSATFRLGDAVGTGTIRELPGAEGVDLNVRENVSGTATFQGWGTAALTGTLNNNGRVVADGYGTDRTLDLSTFSSVTNDLTIVQSDGTQAGWYAQNGGKLTLPPVEVETGSNSYNWGEDAADASLDLINSVRMDLTSVASGGSFSIDLLAADRAEVPAAGELLLLGVWDFKPPTGFDAQAADLTFRYDNLRADELGLDEPDVYAYNLGSESWVAVTDARDPIGHTVSANNVDSFSYYAVGSFLPVLNSSASGLWHQPSTWDRAPMTPDADRRVGVGSHEVTVDADGAAYSLEIAAGGSVAVDAGKTLSVGNEATVGSDATMAVDGTLTAARLTVDGLLSGSGTVNADEIAIGGDVSPGSAAESIGTLTVGGTVVLDSTATYHAQVSLALNEADNIKVSVGSTLQLGGTLEVTGIGRTDADSYQVGVLRTVVDNDHGGVIGEGPLGSPGTEFVTIEPAPASDESSHIGQGAFLRNVIYRTPVDSDNVTGVDLELFVALGGDTDGDGVVWLEDWLTFRPNFDPDGTGMEWTDGDFNGDGKVWLEDWLTFRQNFSPDSYIVAEGEAASPVAVAEPSTLALALGGLVGLIVLIWRRRCR